MTLSATTLPATPTKRRGRASLWLCAAARGLAFTLDRLAMLAVWFIVAELAIRAFYARGHGAGVLGSALLAALTGLLTVWALRATLRAMRRALHRVRQP